MTGRRVRRPTLFSLWRKARLEGKRVALFSVQTTRHWKGHDYSVRRAVFVNKVVRFNHAALSSFCSLARIALGGFNQTFSILSQFLIAPDQRAGFRVRAAA